MVGVVEDEGTGEVDGFSIVRFAMEDSERRI